MTDWKDICREKNGSDVCDSADACFDCVNRAAHMTDTTHDFHAAVHAAVKKTIEEVGLDTLKKMSCFKEGRALMTDTT